MEIINTDIAIIGAGPGGYAAAFHAADAGRRVVLVEQSPRLGGVCLNAGCIPSKALLHATHQITAARESARRGITFGEPTIDIATLCEWKEGVLNKLANGIAMLARKRKVTVLAGRAHFRASHLIEVATGEGANVVVDARHTIIATGTEPALPRSLDIGSSNVITSNEALHPSGRPASMLVIGGGYIGMELGTVYAALGTEITVVEALDGILSGADPDLARPVFLNARRHFKRILLNSTVSSLQATESGIIAEIQSGEKTESATFEKVLVSVGRRPNTENLGLENTLCQLDERGFIRTSEACRTNDPHIHAIGDINGGLLLAHKAARDARLAIDDLLGNASNHSTPRIPAVVFTDPEVAWVGLTEIEAKQRNIPHTVTKFSWGACGRSLTQDRIDGMTKLLVDPENEKLMGIGLVGPGAGELIAEGCLAIEKGATVRDLANTVHPHPTLSETLMEAAELFYGRAVHALPRST
jgi:dihydrolipoamide dehydrogenase